VDRVIAVDVSPAMLERLALHAHEQGVNGIQLVHGDMRRLPLPDASVDVVISCYAFHHLVDDGKELSAAEVYRVLRPGGRLVVVDMMFKLGLGGRDGKIVRAKVKALLRLGVPGVIRLVKNGARVARGRWEHPATLEWWQQMLERRGFADVEVRPLQFEAGLASAVKPAEQPQAR
jgi:ubiquinone/menaquinone biosynthesis C-methylase UbiE